MCRHCVCENAEWKMKWIGFASRMKGEIRENATT